MKLKINIPKSGMLLSLLLIAYQFISSMLWEYSIISSIVSLLMLVIAAIGFFLLLYKPQRKRSITIALLLYFLYGIFASCLNGYFSVYAKEPTMLATSAFWIFLFWIFEQAGRAKLISAETFSKIFFVLTVICFILFCRYYSINQNQYAMLSGLNVVYYLVFMFSIVLMGKNRLLSSIAIVINILAVLLSAKRTAFIVVILTTVVWVLTDLRGQSTRKQFIKTLLYIFLGVVATIIIFTVVEKLNLNILDRIESFIAGDDSDASGRTTIWKSYWNYIQQDSFLHNLIGRGYNATKRNPELLSLGMNWAHNDFLQVLFDYGIIGFLLFSNIILKLFSVARTMRKMQYCYQRHFLISLIVFVFCGFFSMVVLFPQWFLAMAAFWGFVIGDFEQERASL